MKSIWALVGLVMLTGTALVRGQDLGFQVQAGAMTQTLTLNAGPNDTWSYSSTATMTLGSSKIYSTAIGNTGQSGLVIDADPSINYGFGVTNDGTTTQRYTFTFPMPSLALAVNLPAGTYAVSASFGDTLTAAPGHTAQFSLDSGTTVYQQAFIDGVDAGVDIGSGTETTTNGTQVFSFPGVDSQYVLTSTGTAMSITTTFDLSPGDSASFSGSFVVTATPEPGSFGLGLLGLVCFAGLVIRSRQARA